MKTVCKHCHAELSVPDDRAGKFVKCSKCGNPFLAKPASEVSAKPATAPAFPARPPVSAKAESGTSAKPAAVPAIPARPPVSAKATPAAAADKTGPAARKKGRKPVLPIVLAVAVVAVVAVLLVKPRALSGRDPDKPRFFETNGIQALEILLPGGVPLVLHELPGDLWFGRYEVTRAQWRALMGGDEKPDPEKDSFPVDDVRLADVKTFFSRLNNLPAARKSGLVFRIPLDEEYAVVWRADLPELKRPERTKKETRTVFGGGDDDEPYDGAMPVAEDFYPNPEPIFPPGGPEPPTWTRGWTVDHGKDPRLHEVGQKKPSPDGLYDVFGNACEIMENSTSSKEMFYYDRSAWVRRPGLTKRADGDQWIWNPFGESGSPEPGYDTDCLKQGVEGVGFRVFGRRESNPGGKSPLVYADETIVLPCVSPGRGTELRFGDPALRGALILDVARDRIISRGGVNRNGIPLLRTGRTADDGLQTGDIVDLIRALEPGKEIFLRCDEGARTEALKPVEDACRLADVRKVRFVFSTQRYPRSRSLLFDLVSIPVELANSDEPPWRGVINFRQFAVSLH